MNAQQQVQVHIIKVICKSCMYRKIMIQIYLLEDVCKKLYVKVVFRHYNFSEKIMWTKNLSKKGNKTNRTLPTPRALISLPPPDTTKFSNAFSNTKDALS